MAFPINYLGYYDVVEHDAECRNIVPSATTKMDYIAGVLSRLGYPVTFVSMAESLCGTAVPGHDEDLACGHRLVSFPSFGRRGRLFRRFDVGCIGRRMSDFLSSLAPGSVVLAYHSLGYADLLVKAKKRYGFKLVLEVEELYSDVSGRLDDAERERRVFESADSFILSTELMARRIVVGDRPYVVCNGVYRIAPVIARKYDDGLTHVVYAGTLDPRKGGAVAAAGAGAMLDDSFRLHILGFGSDEDIDALRCAVDASNRESRGCLTTYDGYLTGDDFDEFVQSCHIGLSPQDPSAAFNETSFPSKVLMYLSHGLRVVSVDLPVFTSDSLRTALTLCRDNGPGALASGLREARASGSVDSRRVLNGLDVDFGCELGRMLGMVGNLKATDIPSL